MDIREKFISKTLQDFRYPDRKLPVLYFSKNHPLLESRHKMFNHFIFPSLFPIISTHSPPHSRFIITTHGEKTVLVPETREQADECPFRISILESRIYFARVLGSILKIQRVSPTMGSPHKWIIRRWNCVPTPDGAKGRKGEAEDGPNSKWQQAFSRGRFFDPRRGEEIPFYAPSSLLRPSLANILPAYHGTNVLTEALRPPSSCPTGNCARQQLSNDEIETCLSNNFLPFFFFKCMYRIFGVLFLLRKIRR